MRPIASSMEKRSESQTLSRSCSPTSIDSAGTRRKADSSYNGSCVSTIVRVEKSGLSNLEYEATT